MAAFVGQLIHRPFGTSIMLFSNCHNVHENNFFLNFEYAIGY